MNTSTVSSFFSRDVFLSRQARTNKRLPRSNICPSTSSLNKPLPMIIEEDEPRHLATGQNTQNLGASGSQKLGAKSKRRHANLSVSDIRLAKSALIHDVNDLTQQNSALLSTPRPAPLPPLSPSHSPESSPDSFRLKFPDASLRFPHPPTPSRAGSESPAPSMSSSSSTSPESRSCGLPTTPSSSDDEEFPSYYSSPLPSFKPRRISIKPLVITKHNLSSSPDVSVHSNSSSPLREHKIVQEYALPSPPSPSESEDHSDSEESDSEWYHRELSKILTLCSPAPSNFSQSPRPDSICVSDKPLALRPTTPTSASSPHGFPSLQLDPTYPRRRRSRASIPNYPPPPIPTTPEKNEHFPSTPSKASKRRTSTLTVTPPPSRRPPPSSDVPADCVWVDETLTFSDDNVSAFSFSLYDSPCFADSPKSCYSQPSFLSPHPSPFPSSFPSTPSSFPSSPEEEFDFPVDEIEFDMDLERSLIPQLSLPTSPIDLETDITSRFEELRNSPQPLYQSVSDVFSAPTNSIIDTITTLRPSTSEEPRELRSRWSSSTLNSIHEEHARRSGLGLVASAKLRAYFGSSPSSSSPKSSKFRSTASRRSGFVAPATPLTPTSPTTMKRSVFSRRESDVVSASVGYGFPSEVHALRRRGSLSPSVSDAGSEDTTSSSGSSKLRRKPIPVEMFLRSAA